jgi:hypothetical protein
VNKQKDRKPCQKIKSDANAKLVYGGEGRTGDSNMQTGGKDLLLSCSIEHQLHLWPRRHSLQMEVEVT